MCVCVCVYLTQVTFLTELGDLPSLQTFPAFEVEPTTAGNKENSECGGHGFCGKLSVE